MDNKNKWLYDYNSLNARNQLEIAEAILNVLKDNEVAFGKSEYNKEKSIRIRELLHSIAHNAKSESELKRIVNILQEFESLSPNNKSKVINEIFDIIIKYLNIQEQENKEKQCEHEGHLFENWIHNKWTTYTDTVIDHQYVHNFPENHQNWERSCKRCGFKECVDIEPQELIDARIEEDKKVQIKKLELELKKLKNE